MEQRQSGFSKADPSFGRHNPLVGCRRRGVRALSEGSILDQVAAPRRKPSQIRYPSQLAKSYWFYTPAEVIALYKIYPNTLANWVKEGLQRVEGKELVYRGDVLNAFHKARNEKRRRPCGPTEAFCLQCKQPRTLIGTNTHKMVWTNELVGKLYWSCPVCAGGNEIFLKRSQYQSLEAAGARLNGVAHD
jgi:hypothetical protein